MGNPFFYSLVTHIGNIFQNGIFQDGEMTCACVSKKVAFITHIGLFLLLGKHWAYEKQDVLAENV